MSRPTRATLDLAALRHNVAQARRLAPDAKLMAVVKANAYGHGAVPVASELQQLADALAVACVEEALELREAGITAPILLLEGPFDAEELSLCTQFQLWVTIENEAQLQWLEQARLSAPVPCWLKVNTGMNRLGISPALVESFFARLGDCANAGDVVVYTHFANADDLTSDQTPRQLALFDKLCLPAGMARSAANSAGLLAWPQAHYDWVRPGYMLYGNSPMLQDHPNTASLQAVMTFSSAIASLRDVDAGQAVGYGGDWIAARPSRIATVTVGYGDGYPRQAPNGTPVLVNGQRAPLAGRVSMDMITVDVTDLDDVKAGDEVVLWGKGLPVAEVAAHAGTIGYELTTRMPARTPRVPVNG